MIEAYAIAVTMSLKGNISAEIGKVSAQFEALNKVIAASQMAVNELAAGMRGLQRVGRSAADAWTQAANAMNRASQAARSAQSGGGGNAGNAARAGAVPSVVRRGGGSLTPPLLIQGPSGGLIAIPGGGGAGGGGVNGGGSGGGGGGIPLNLGGSRPPLAMPGSADLAMAAGGFGLLGVGLMHFVESAIKARAEVEALQSNLRLAGLSAAQTSEALKLATNLQQTVPGTKIISGLEIIKDIFTVTQNTTDALDLDLIRKFSQASVILGAIGKHSAIGELFKAMQAGELRGEFSGANGEPDPRKAAEFLRRVVTTTIQTGGRVGPSELFQVLKSGGLGGAIMSNDTLFADMIAPIISMGAARAGTGIQAFASQFTAGKMSDAAVRLLTRMQLFQNLPTEAGTTDEQQYAFLKEHYKTGIGQYAIPMQFMPYRNNPELNPAQNPIEFMMKVLMPVFDAYNLKTNGPPRDAADLMVQRMAQALAVASRIPAGNEMGDVFRNIPLIVRERESALKGNERNQGDAAFQLQQQTNPQVALAAFPAAINGLMVALGGPIMETALAMIKDLTALLNKISDFAEKHPTLTKNIMETTAAVGAFSGAMAILSGVFLVAGPMITVLKLLPAAIEALAVATGLFAVGTPAGLALVAIVAGLTALAYVLVKLAPTAAEFKAGGAAAEGLAQIQRRGAAGMGNVPTDGFGVDGMPIARPQSYAPPPRAANVQSTPIVFHLDGREVARGVIPHIGREMNGAPSGRTGFDTRLSPRYAGAVFAA